MSAVPPAHYSTNVFNCPYSSFIKRAHTDKGVNTTPRSHINRPDRCSLVGKEPKWVSPPGATAASAPVRRDARCNHRNHQSHSAILKTAEEERKRGLERWRVARFWLTATLANRWGKHSKGKKQRRAMQRSRYKIMTREWLKQIQSQAVAASLFWRTLIGK